MNPPLQPAPQSTPPPGPVPDASAGPARTSGLAIASLVMGFFGFLFLPAIGGIVCGILATNSISKSGGRLKGKGIAISGIIVSGAMILMIPVLAILAGMLLPALAKSKEKAQIIQSVNHLKQIGLAARITATDNNEKLPESKGWCDTLMPVVGNPSVFQRPLDSTGARCGYGYNSAVAGLSADKVNPSTVLFFELDSGGWNISGGPELLRNPRNRSEPVVVCLVDGSVQQVRGDRIASLRWDP